MILFESNCIISPHNNLEQTNILYSLENASKNICLLVYVNKETVWVSDQKGCVRSYANSTIGLQMTFRVQPFITLAYHLYHWLPTGFTIGSIFCRRSRAWVKRFTRENYVIKMEDLKNLSTETSGETTIFLI